MDHLVTSSGLHIQIKKEDLETWIRLACGLFVFEYLQLLVINMVMAVMK